MRNFEERKAEIFRRSESRIEARKRNRNRILAVCIPLCLTLTVGAVTILPGMLSAGKNRVPGENAAMPEYTGKGTACAVQIERISADSKYQYLEQQPYVLPEDIEKLYYSMESALEMDRGNEQHKEQDNLTDSSGKIDEEEFTLGGAGDPLPSYRITFTMENGTKVIYTLDGYVLKKDTGDDQIVLTQSQRTQLLETLALLIVPKEETK